MSQSTGENLPSGPAIVTPKTESSQDAVEGQLNSTERALLADAILFASARPQVVLEVGTWLGGGSTLHILRALEKNGQGHLWGIEADKSIYERMLTNLRERAPEAMHRFTPLFGFSQQVIPRWIAEQPPGFKIDFAFLDGGNRPLEQITEFQLIDPHMPVGGQLMAHDAKLRKGKWLVPYLSRLDHWQVKLHDVSEEGLLHARKIAERPSTASRKAAAGVLFRLKWEPAELAAVLLPARLRGFILGLMPRKLSVRLSDGRR